MAKFFNLISKKLIPCIKRSSAVVKAVRCYKYFAFKLLLKVMSDYIKDSKAIHWFHYLKYPRPLALDEVPHQTHLGLEYLFQQ